jgi:glucose/arabinose dehydrogenase
VILHPQFSQNHWIYLSYAEAGQGGQGAVVIRAKLDLNSPNQPKLMEIEKIWQQVPKVSGQGHYAHRLAFDREGKLWISSGERQNLILHKTCSPIWVKSCV